MAVLSTPVLSTRHFDSFENKVHGIEVCAEQAVVCTLLTLYPKSLNVF